MTAPARAMTDRQIVQRSMLSRWFSTALTTITVAVAVALMIVLVSLRSSAKSVFERGSGNMHLLVSADTSPLVSVLNSVFYAGTPARSIGFIEYQRLARDPRVAWCVPTLVGDSYKGFPVVATTREFFTRFDVDVQRSVPSDSGTDLWRFRSGGSFDGNFEVVLGVDAATSAGLNLHDHLSLTHGMSGLGGHVHDDFEFEVVGILARTGTPHDRAVFVSLESSWILHAHDRREREGLISHDEKVDHDDHDHAGHDHERDHTPPTTIDDVTLDDQRITAIMVHGRTRDGRETSASIGQIAGELRSNPLLTVADPTSEVNSLFALIGGVDIVLRAMAGVVLVSSGIGIMLALYNSMDQRKRQIAVLRVLGASRWRVLRLVLGEAAMIGVFGSVLGVVVAFASLSLVTAVLKTWTGVVVDPNISGAATIGIAGGAVLIATLAGVFPAILAYRTSVAKNLKPLG